MVHHDRMPVERHGARFHPTDQIGAALGAEKGEGVVEEVRDRYRPLERHGKRCDVIRARGISEPAIAACKSRALQGGTQLFGLEAPDLFLANERQGGISAASPLDLLAIGFVREEAGREFYAMS